MTLPSGPGVPPVSQLGPCSVAFERWPGKIMPLSGTEKRKVSPKSNIACMPIANHKLPVRFSVKLQKIPTKTTPATPIQPSPVFCKCTAPNETDRRTAAGQKPMPSATVYSAYPRKRNSSKKPTTRKKAPQNSAHLAMAVPCSAMLPKEYPPIAVIRPINTRISHKPNAQPSQNSFPKPSLKGNP